MNEEEKQNLGQEPEGNPAEEQKAPQGEGGQEEASADTQSASQPQGQEAGESAPQGPMGAEGEELPQEGEEALQEAPVESAEPQEPPLNITQSQLNSIIQERVARAVQKAMEEGYAKGRDEIKNSLYSKYGVDDDDGLDQLFGDGERYGPLSDQFKQQSDTNAGLLAENAMLKSHILPTRMEDVKAWAEHQGLQVTPETIAQGLQTHPEWVQDPTQAAQVPQMGAAPQPQPISITQFGGEPSMGNSQGQPEDERAKALDYFK